MLVMINLPNPNLFGVFERQENESTTSIFIFPEFQTPSLNFK